eukprot:TRINITY_DN6077_c0_g1_i1.p1 TRINITY_DN6077_c0_g1~~TRINITY_DN6077_c0_g1_i1.p1  ORF type:complete len:503 (-),score=105.05 TRINITY_DN6077_c0_g1_i1:267-1775(-)
MEETIRLKKEFKDKIHGDDVLEKIDAIRKMDFYSRGFSKDGIIEDMLSVVKGFLSDFGVSTAIREHCISALGDLGVFVLQSDYDEGVDIFHHLIEMIVVGFSFKSNDVRTSALKSFVKVVECLSYDDVEQYVVPLINKLNSSSEESENVGAISLINELGYLFSTEYNEDNFLSIYEKAASHASFRLRTAALSSMEKFVKSISKEKLSNSIIPLIKLLSEDHVWGVRRECANVLPSVSEICSSADRNSFLAPLYKTLINDSSVWVRNSSYKNFGPFIVTCTDKTIIHSLVGEFVKIPLKDDDIHRSCAFNFPAVLQTAGREHWADLSPMYHKLVNYKKEDTRITLAHSFFIVVNILGTDIAEDELVTVLDQYLRDTQDIRYAILTNLDKILSVLRDETRTKYFNIIQSNFNSEKWRDRYSIANILFDLMKLFTSSDIKDELLSYVYEFLEDNVTKVREAILPQVGKIYEHISTERKSVYLSFVNKLPSDPSHKKRIMFYRYQP